MPKTIHRVLLIDDDNMTNYLHKRAIEKANLCSSFIIANNGEQGVDALLLLNDILNENDRVLIFLDINMPVMDGWEFLKILEEIKLQIRFKILLFMVSSSLNPDHMNRASKESLVTNYLKKPITTKLIEEVIEEIIADFYN